MSYIQLLTKIKNASALHKETVRFPYSKLNEAVLTVLSTSEFIDSFEKKGKNPKKFFDIQLKYKNGQPAIQDVKFVSTPSRRLYVKKDEIRPIRQGYGTSVVSTSQGIMTGKESRTKKIGGQILFNIW
ncbi:30S ribosomal protein S8 [Candidatus Wolfebacteria bacterium RIFCSPHIGHO2_01_FULL_48_22]|uniref:Small ribosomal subunit protein uS8 n=2 Tax=Candidatus Wolfeibacteriota TaxID=1752735 RepID=A0A1F8DR79_9BACT|nr:MAG: 30S ribosomal protein S8 [Candidatus Wolfebacteria bacterium RIFCSPHIGHO2_01_FULL_48_22]OGM91977.1 MAG: 30S ribosomal protein S8 [Candidatus Wolfebacteria bacterium RIFCSPLOWO2_01_FULL_47_17b]